MTTPDQPHAPTLLLRVEVHAHIRIEVFTATPTPTPHPQADCQAYLDRCNAEGVRPLSPRGRAILREFSQEFARGRQG